MPTNCTELFSKFLLQMIHSIVHGFQLLGSSLIPTDLFNTLRMTDTVREVLMIAAEEARFYTAFNFIATQGAMCNPSAHLSVILREGHQHTKHWNPFYAGNFFDLAHLGYTLLIIISQADQFG